MRPRLSSFRIAVVAGVLLTSSLSAPDARSAHGEREGLAPLALKPLPLGSIKPAGWLKTQLEIQAGGLGGHLDEFWPDVKDSSWIGGKAEGWERGPYWLDGFIPLAVLLDKPELKARAKAWVDHVLKTQKEDGWLGPMKGNPDPNSRLSEYDVWPRFILLKALTQWHEATGDERIIPAMQRFFVRLDKVLDQKPLEEWARVRWADLSLSIYWLYDRTGDASLLALGRKVHDQGLDWVKLGRDFPYREKVTRTILEGYKAANGGRWINDQFGATHGVNVGMGVKAPGVWFRQSRSKADLKAAHSLLESLDRYHGQATGMYACDEHLAGKHPSQGTELCTVVELMYSLENLLAIAPDVRLADRLESITYNALPATFTDDMWAHQYDQQVNQVVCKVSKERIYANNGPDSNLFGLEPTFGCCLANMHQGWPKFAAHLWMKSTEGLTALAYAPCELKTKVGDADVRLSVRTEYPFKEQIEITVNASKPTRFPLELRIPEWAHGATVAVAGKTKSARAGKFHEIDRTWAGETKVLLTLPMSVRVERRYNNSATVHRGPIIYSLKIGQDWRKLRDKHPTADWEVYPTTPWNYALRIEPAYDRSVSYVRRPVAFSVETEGITKGAFASDAPPVRITALGRKLPSWQLVLNAADAPPKGPVTTTSELPEKIELIPYGCAKLRVTEFPVLGTE